MNGHLVYDVLGLSEVSCKIGRVCSGGGGGGGGTPISDLYGYVRPQTPPLFTLTRSQLSGLSLHRVTDLSCGIKSYIPISTLSSVSHSIDLRNIPLSGNNFPSLVSLGRNHFRRLIPGYEEQWEEQWENMSTESLDTTSEQIEGGLGQREQWTNGDGDSC